MANHKEPIIALARAAFNMTAQSDDEVIERVQKECSVDLEDLSDDQIDDLQAELIQKKRQAARKGSTNLSVPVKAPQKMVAISWSIAH